jgi:hypothetical protein
MSPKTPRLHIDNTIEAKFDNPMNNRGGFDDPMEHIHIHPDTRTCSPWAK